MSEEGDLLFYTVFFLRFLFSKIGYYKGMFTGYASETYNKYRILPVRRIT